MYRVVIVDDEEPVLNSFEFIFEKHVIDFTICGKARNGNDAIKIVKDLIPDLVFMDIEMPGINGLDVIKQLQLWVPKTLFILSTAYERFDIAQKAITTGVFDYLVKPVSKNQILQELDKVRLELDKRNEFEKLKNESLKQVIEQNNEKDENFLNSIIWNSISENNWLDAKERNNIQYDSGSIIIIETLSNINDLLRVKTYKEISQKIKFRYTSLSTISGDKLIILISTDSNKTRINDYVNRVLSEINSITFHLGQGEIYNFIELNKSYKEALFSLDNEISCYNSNDLLNIYNELIFSSKEHGLMVFEEYWKWVFTNNNFEVAKGIMISLFTLLMFKIEKERIDIAEEIIPIDSIEKWKKWSLDAIDKFYLLLNNDKLATMPKPLKIALNYIKDNFADSLQLSSVAEICSVSSSHLSRLFTEHLGTKFIDYLNVYRIERATELLKNSNLSIKEAAFSVGYNDPNYFSRIYRKYMGVSPSEID
ncbi:MAG: response regulator [Spirochaetales bacterium]|nr:response regulator [Spirochaetales bacterium]